LSRIVRVVSLHVDDRQQRGSCWDADLAWCRPGWCGDVGESFQELVEGGLAVVDGGALVVGEGMFASIFWRLSFASSSWPLLELFGV
jgi:hypothetical protein